MSTPIAFQRGLVLYHQGRHDLAEAEFRRVLAAAPDDPTAHAYLALCLSARDDRKAEALAEAEEAVRLDPDEALGHYARGYALHGLDREKEAEASAREALRLGPDSPDHYALLAAIAVARRRYPEALDAAGQGLAIDPEHAVCTNLRALSLVHLGRKDEAAQVLGSALADDPENALTHANQGRTCLHQGDHKQALIHFREALRLDPELEWARAGIVEALKARYLVYRLMLGFFLWMSRKSTFVQWGLILGLIFGRRFLAGLANANPALAPLINPILYLTFGFLVLTWIASPLFNLVLRFNKFGRMALSPAQTVESTWIGGCFLLAAAGLLIYLPTTSDLAFWMMAYFGLLLFPLTTTFHQAPGKPRRVAAACTFALALLGLPLLLGVLLGPASPFSPKETVSTFEYFRDGSILSTWVPALLGLRATVR